MPDASNIHKKTNAVFFIISPPVLRPGRNSYAEAAPSFRAFRVSLIPCHCQFKVFPHNPAGFPEFSFSSSVSFSSTTSFYTFSSQNSRNRSIEHRAARIPRLTGLIREEWSPLSSQTALTTSASAAPMPNSVLPFSLKYGPAASADFSGQ